MRLGVTARLIDVTTQAATAGGGPVASARRLSHVRIADSSAGANRITLVASVF